MRHSVLLTALLGLALAGCASNKNDEQVSIATAENGQLFEGAACTVQTDKQSWDITTPVTLDIGAADGELRIACTKDGYDRSELRLMPGQTASNGPSVGLGLGGASGGIGSIIGAGLSLSLPFGKSQTGTGPYPPQITVNMTRQQNVDAATEKQ